MALVKKIEITNFGALCRVKARVGALNVIAGAEGSGKTFMLDALYIALGNRKLPLRLKKNPAGAIRAGAKRAVIALELEDSKKRLELFKPEAGDFMRALAEELTAGIKFLSQTKNRDRGLGATLGRALEDGSALRAVSNALKSEDLADKLRNALEGALAWSDGSSSGYFRGWAYEELYADALETALAELLNAPVYEVRGFALYAQGALEQKGKGERPLYIKDPVLLLRRFILGARDKETVALEVQRALLEEKLVPGLERFSFGDLVLKGRRAVPLELMGAGFASLASLLGVLSMVKEGSVLLLDNPFARMGARYSEVFVKRLSIALKEKRAQAFVTAGDRSALESIKRAGAEANVVLLEKNGNCSSGREADIDEALALL